MSTARLLSSMLAALLAAPGFASDLPKNTKLEVRLDQTLSSDTASTGERFTATLDRTISIGEQVVLRKGARVEGIVSFAESTFNYTRAGELELQLTSVVSDGQTYSIQTNTLMRAGRARPIDPRTGRADDTGARRADATRAAVDALGVGPPGITQTIPGTNISAGTGNSQSGMQVVLPTRSKLNFTLTSASLLTKPH